MIQFLVCIPTPGPDLFALDAQEYKSKSFEPLAQNDARLRRQSMRTELSTRARFVCFMIVFCGKFTMYTLTDSGIEFEVLGIITSVF